MSPLRIGLRRQTFVLDLLFIVLPGGSLYKKSTIGQWEVFLGDRVRGYSSSLRALPASGAGRQRPYSPGGVQQKSGTQVPARELYTMSCPASFNLPEVALTTIGGRHALLFCGPLLSHFTRGGLQATQTQARQTKRMS